MLDRDIEKGIVRELNATVTYQPEIISGGVNRQVEESFKNQIPPKSDAHPLTWMTPAEAIAKQREMNEKGYNFGYSRYTGKVRH